MNLKKLLFALVLLSSMGVSAQVYVKHDAAGANNGQSWADAYTDLQLAFDNAAEGDQIWVAAGEYKPRVETTSREATFDFAVDIELYGGFAGTETSLDGRDFNANQTILTGDHNDDDLISNYEMNREDNSMHVMFLTADISDATIIDGIIFSNGQTAPADSSGNMRRGGGLLTYGAPTLRNCTFTQNFGHFGGGFYPRGSGADNMVVDNCSFLSNQGTFGGGGYVTANVISFTNCIFEDNIATELAGGLYNSADDGATIDNCLFKENSAINSRAGGLYCTGSPSIVTNCTFERNRAQSSSGGGMQVRNSDDTDPFVTVTVSNCTFSLNSARWGGAFGTYDQQSASDVSNCTFQNNSSTTSGGAATNAFGAQSTFTNCLFKSNSSNTGGAIFSQNDSARINLSRCVFEENQASENGGALNIGGDGEVTSTEPRPQLNVDRTSFLGNVAIQQGAGINFSNSDLNMVNCLAIYNLVESVEGIGGFISLNVSDSLEANYSIMNSTIAQNTAVIGAGISNWEGQDTFINGKSTLVMQNVILYNPDGNDYEIEAGDPAVVSNGGNLASDNTMNGILNGPSDLTETNPGFVDDFVDFHLTDDSPAVNAGIADGAPNVDLDGNPRVGNVDMGAYENQVVVGVHDITRNAFGELSVYPIPVQTELTLEVENDYFGSFEVAIFNSAGEIVHQTLVDKTTASYQEKMNISNLANDVYLIRVGIDGRVSTYAFVK